MRKSGGRSFASNLYQLRNAANMSQSDLAKKIWGTTEDTRGYQVARNRDLISNYEAGKSAPNRTNLERLAEVLGVSPEELAPDLMAERTAGQTRNSPIQISLLPDDPTKAYLQVSTIVSAEAAYRIATMIAEETLPTAG